jgi:YebC/PmpR family DNA-binding regulatory protein
MSGHSKWSTIKHKKAALDAKRGKKFTKVIKEITVAARLGGGDPDGNPRLRFLIDKAKDINMPSENVTRAIKKGTGELPGVNYEQYTYEGYGPSGIAVMVDTLSDNKNRTVADLRHLFASKGGNLAENGAVGWMFAKMGVVKAIIPEGVIITEDALLEKLLDYDVQDIHRDDNLFSIVADPKSLEKVKQCVLQAGLKIETADVEWVPKTTTCLPDDQAEKAYEFLNALEDNDDVQNVYTNLD